MALAAPNFERISNVSICYPPLAVRCFNSLQAFNAGIGAPPPCLVGPGGLVWRVLDEEDIAVRAGKSLTKKVDALGGVQVQHKV